MFTARRLALFGLFLALTLYSVGTWGATSKAVQTCSWSSPGSNPYTGTFHEAIDSYVDIPLEIRSKLKARMDKWDYDDLVEIKRDSITSLGGGQRYSPHIWSMHFGSGSVCSGVDRSGWTTEVQGAMVFCEEGHCLLLPAVCRNISRIFRPTKEVLGGTPPISFEALAELPPLEPLSHEAPEESDVSAVSNHPSFTRWSHAPMVGTSAPPTVITPVPEPTVVVLMVVGLLLISLYRRK
jgi:hypothetical protein